MILAALSFVAKAHLCPANLQLLVVAAKFSLPRGITLGQVDPKVLHFARKLVSIVAKGTFEVMLSVIQCHGLDATAMKPRGAAWSPQRFVSRFGRHQLLAYAAFTAQALLLVLLHFLSRSMRTAVRLELKQQA